LNIQIVIKFPKAIDEEMNEKVEEFSL
jgi:hypothetical protein